MSKKLWVSATDKDGSFCDTESEHHYDVVGGAEKEIQLQTIQDDGGEGIVTDGLPDPEDSYSVDQKFVTYRTEDDNQAGTVRPAKHRVGGV